MWSPKHGRGNASPSKTMHAESPKNVLNRTLWGSFWVDPCSLRLSDPGAGRYFNFLRAISSRARSSQAQSLDFGRLERIRVQPRNGGEGGAASRCSLLKHSRRPAREHVRASKPFSPLRTPPRLAHHTPPRARSTATAKTRRPRVGAVFYPPLALSPPGPGPRRRSLSRASSSLLSSVAG